MNDNKHTSTHHKILQAQQDIVLSTDAKQLAQEKMEQESDALVLSEKASKAMQLQRKIDATKDGSATKRKTKIVKSTSKSRTRKSSLALPSKSRAASSGRSSLDTRNSHRKISRMVDSVHTKNGQQAPSLTRKKSNFGIKTQSDKLAEHAAKKKIRPGASSNVNEVRSARPLVRRTSSIVGRYREMQEEHPNLYGNIGAERMVNLRTF